MKPTIGVTTYCVKDSEMDRDRVRGLPGQDMLMSTMDNLRAVEKAGGIPLAIPLIQNDEYIEDLVRKMDGFLFTGGSDVNPIKYGQPFKRGLGRIVPERDEFELQLLERALFHNKPILCICRGLQLLNVLCKGTLHQDIYQVKLTDLEHAAETAPRYQPRHKVTLAEGSKVYHAYGQKEFYVNSFHHQAIDKIGENLVATGWSEDGIIEVLEHKDHDFVVGVQWHPEMAFEVHEEHLSIFHAFVQASLHALK